jgi:predicted Zn-dependent protease
LNSGDKTECSLAKDYKRLCFKAKDNNELNVFFAQYGSDIPAGELYNLSNQMIEKLNNKLGSIFKFNNLGIVSVDFDVTDEQIAKLKENPKIANFERERLKRLYSYYEVVGNRGVITDNVHQGLLENPSMVAKLKKADLIFVFSNAQFEGLGYTIGNMTVLKYPTEIGWETEGGGRVEKEFTNSMMSTSIHELGHGLGLKHSAHQCQGLNISLEEKKHCCDESPNKDDIMSYCRDRTDPNLEFGECSMKNLKEVTAELLKTGGKFDYQKVQDCN